MQPQHTEHEPASPSFAGLLAALTASKANSPQLHSPQSFTQDLQDDVATLSYERALQNHTRVRSSQVPAAFGSANTPPPRSDAAVDLPQAEKKAGPIRKSASVTVRMSEEEFAQLQQRAAEAMLTISAYLRSCTFEAEALRAQVKQALAEIRNSSAIQPHPEPAGPKWLRLLRRRKPVQMPDQP